jgi:hypothetical protein
MSVVLIFWADDNFSIWFIPGAAGGNPRVTLESYMNDSAFIWGHRFQDYLVHSPVDSLGQPPSQLAQRFLPSFPVAFSVHNQTHFIFLSLIDRQTGN